MPKSAYPQREANAFRWRDSAKDGYRQTDQLADLMQHEGLPDHHHAHPRLPLQPPTSQWMCMTAV